MRASTKNKYDNKLIELITKIEEKNGYFFYDGYFCNLEKKQTDIFITVSFFKNKLYLGLFQTIIKIETKKDFKYWEAYFIRHQNTSLILPEYKFQNILANYGNCIKNNMNLFIYEIKYDNWNFIRMYDDKMKDKIIYEKSEGNSEYAGITQFLYGNNMTKEIMFIYNTIRYLSK